MANQNFEFNLQQFLETMESRLLDAHEKLSEKVDNGFKAAAKQHVEHAREDSHQFAEMDKRISAQEATARTVKWGGRTALGAVLVDALSHLW